MTYSGNISKNILWGIILISVFILPNLSWMFRFSITLAWLVVTLHQVQLTITSEQLEYKIKLFKFTIYRRILTPEKINKIKFCRIGWSMKNAVVKVRGGFNFSVAYFNSEQLKAELEEFALAKNVEIQKTKDYLLLEKYYSNN
ncbi:MULTISPECIES: hypothetical protein [unclassified Bacillus (in: firmicutes)]|uniref:hypothetical protein n=1 Tax=unclassified Bacillus (in: firmicutes) TaxID=185979 RepID=UPI001BE50872|nr:MULTISPECIES: hypothetical protein [unclassified Bacillus (in: firmicutes)]MBT2637575.1 hypothetical protein [Bacillus sp. ISL-39]MBT2662129.1 hypothetical protein [Bacillus sp. ISL-45]